MKKSFLVICFCLLSSLTFAQWTVSYHQSSFLPFVGVNKQFGERFIPEFRLGTNDFLSDFDVELVANLILAKKESFEFYGGIGPHIGDIDGVVIPIGLNVYPFAKKDFGFQMEIAPMIGSFDWLRGSIGIRYRFLKDE
ncbi:hypothetical protein JYB64_04010 [Algoriphagus aestuarii]|nr:hypothetical protein [Algoriphagus aestuarii]